jgi:hypothetical protein
MLVDGIRIYRKAKGSPWDSKSSCEMLERFVRRVALPANLPVEHYQAAVQGVQTLFSERPDDPSGWILQGFAQYRTQQWSAAESSLVQAVEKRSASDAAVSDQDECLRLAFLAMTQCRLGRPDQGKTTWSELKQKCELNADKDPADVRAVLAEAEQLVLRP